MEDFIKHLRSIHFSLTIASFGCLLIIFLGPNKSLLHVEAELNDLEILLARMGGNALVSGPNWRALVAPYVLSGEPIANRDLTTQNVNIIFEPDETSVRYARFPVVLDDDPAAYFRDIDGIPATFEESMNYLYQLADLREVEIVNVPAGSLSFKLDGDTLELEPIEYLRVSESELLLSDNIFENSLSSCSLIQSGEDGYLSDLNVSVGDSPREKFMICEDGDPSEDVYILHVKNQILKINYGQIFLDELGMRSEYGSDLMTRKLFQRLSNYIPYGLENLEPNQIRMFLDSEIERSGESIELLGLKIPSYELRTWGVLILISIQIYFLLHLERFSKLSSDYVEGATIPWVGIYPVFSARAATVCTSSILPTMAVSYLFYSANKDIGILVAGPVLVVAFSLTLSYATYLSTRRIYISYRSL